MVHTSTEDEDSREDDQNHGFQERLIMSVALLTAVSLISATVMALVQLLQLEEYKPGAEGGRTKPRTSPTGLWWLLRLHGDQCTTTCCCALLSRTTPTRDT
ncbi:hypothetical protein MRX96_017612 [Rhipicephalus microplus]